MRVIGIKAKKILSNSAVLIVKFISLIYLKNIQIQLFCASLEPKTSPGQGAGLSIMTAVKITRSGANPLFDIGVRCKPRSDTTRNMIAAFDCMMGGTIFDAMQASSDDFETSEQNPLGDECYLRSSQDPVSYSKAAPDPKHHGQAMQSAMKAEWIKRQTSEMDRIWRCGVFQKELCSLPTPQDRVFTSCFHYKIKRKGKEFGKYKVRLVVQGQHTHTRAEKAKTVSAISTTLSALYLPQPDSARFSVWLHNEIFSMITSIFLKLSFEENYCQETAIMARCIFLHLRDTM